MKESTRIPIHITNPDWIVNLRNNPNTGNEIMKEEIQKTIEESPILKAIFHLEQGKFVRVGDYIFKKSVNNRFYGDLKAYSKPCVIYFLLSEALKGPLDYTDVSECRDYADLNHYFRGDKPRDVEVLDNFEFRLAGN
jgi:hypothetical protein